MAADLGVFAGEALDFGLGEAAAETGVEFTGKLRDFQVRRTSSLDHDHKDLGLRTMGRT